MGQRGGVVLIPVTTFRIIVKKIIRLGEGMSVPRRESGFEEGGLRSSIREVPGKNIVLGRVGWKRGKTEGSCRRSHPTV
jgi:hypothetical protein